MKKVKIPYKINVPIDIPIEVKKIFKKELHQFNPITRGGGAKTCLKPKLIHKSNLQTPFDIYTHSLTKCFVAPHCTGQQISGPFEIKRAKNLHQI